MTAADFFWWQAAPEVVAALALIFVPGLAVVRSLGGRGLVVLGLVPAVSAAVVGVAAIASEALGVRSITLMSAVLTALLSVLGLLARRLIPALRPESHAALRRQRNRRVAAAFWGGLGIGVVLLAWRVSQGLIGPANFSQNFDIVFHLNAVRRAVDGAGSSLTMGSFMGESGILSFYPAAWHDLAGAVAQLVNRSGLEQIPFAVSAVDLVVASVVWPLGCVALVRAVAGPRPYALLAAGALAAGSGTFPLRLLDWGVVLPFFYGTALAPGVLAVVILLCRITAEARRNRLRNAVLVLGACLGLALAHASVIVFVVALALPAAFAGLWEWRRRRRSAGLSLLPPHLAMLGVVLFVIALWYVLRPKNGFGGWDTPRSFVAAVLTTAANIPLGGVPPVVIVILLVIGLIGCLLRRNLRWFVGSYAIAALLLITVSGVPRSLFRTVLVGPWYEDPFRVAPLLVIVATVAGALGADFLVRRLTLTLRRRRGGPTPTRRVGPIIAAVLLAALIPSSQVVVTRDVLQTEKGYRLDDASVLITPNELTLLGRLGDEVPPGDVIADNPWDGSALAYAFTGRRVLTQHLLYSPYPDQSIVDNHLRDAVSDPEVCPALERTGVRWVLDFGPYLEVNPGTENYPGLDGLDSSTAVTEVDREGDAVLYRITACG